MALSLLLILRSPQEERAGAGGSSSRDISTKQNPDLEVSPPHYTIFLFSKVDLFIDFM